MKKSDIKPHVYAAISAIPQGSVCSYGTIAELAGIPGAARHIGRLLKELPIKSQLPWHRIVRANGQIAFNADSPQFIKQLTKLESENVTVCSGKINMSLFGWK